MTVHNHNVYNCWNWRLLVFSILLHGLPHGVQGRSLCSTDEDCVSIGPSTSSSSPSSRCIQGTCHHDETHSKYQKGCLRERLGGALRVCNSDDPQPTSLQQGLCRMPSIPHTEVRLYAREWESSLFQAWILQVILSELLDVPTSIEMGRLDAQQNFYQPDHYYDSNQNNDLTDARGEIVYNEFTSMLRAMENLQQLGDCRFADKTPAKYQTCAHVAPEALDSYFTFQWYMDRGVIEMPRPTGMLGRYALFIPKFTAEQDPSLLSYLGMQGEKNRQKMADTFLRPTTWQDYCEQVSTHNCTYSDNVTARAPRNKQEGSHFFVPGLYRGHFRKTSKNMCHNTTGKCTGHVADLPCGMPSPVEPQMYHLGIALEGDGSQPHTKGYYRWELREIWKAANATHSNVAMYWFAPEALYEEFVGTDAEFTKVTFPLATQECIDYRKQVRRCSAVFDNRMGDPRAVCEEPPAQTQMLISKALANLTNAMPEAIRSPAYDMLRLFTLTDLRLAEILEASTQPDISPRQAVCNWVENNLDFIYDSYVPPTYPRVIEEEQYAGIMYSALAIGFLSCCLVVWTFRETYRLRRKPIVRNAQVEFLYFVLAGSLLIATGAIVAAAPPSDATCVMQVWLINFGYTLSLVPQIVKVQAINRLMMAARRYHRMYFDLKTLYGCVALLSGLELVYLMIWSIMDPPQKHASYDLTDDVTEDGKSIVNVGYACQGSSDLWGSVAISWNGLLLLWAVVLAFQTRNLRNAFNESRSLGNLIYANFIFLIFRAVTFFMSSSFATSILPRVQSIIFSLDVIGSLVVYFVPKLLEGVQIPYFSNCFKSNDQGGGISASSHSSGLTPPRSRLNHYNNGRTRISGLHRGVEHSLRMEIPPTNPFLRFLTGISNITTFQDDHDNCEPKDEETAQGGGVSGGEDVTDRALDGSKPMSMMSDQEADSDDDTTVKNATGTASQEKDSDEFNSSTFSFANDCDADSDHDNEPPQPLLSERAAYGQDAMNSDMVIRHLQEQVDHLQRRLEVWEQPSPRWRANDSDDQQQATIVRHNRSLMVSRPNRRYRRTLTK